MERLNLSDWIDCTEVEGPGKRFVLWVQGCLLRCPKCCNPHMLDFSPRRVISAEELFELVLYSKNHYLIEGLTFLGGEPFLQAKGLAFIAHKARKIGLSVVVFSGYTLEYLMASEMSGVPSLLFETDLLIDGPFNYAQIERSRNWVGSENQRFHFLTDFYSPGIEYDSAFRRGCEIRINSNFELAINGWPYKVLQDEILIK
jgi:anaerobic ribonucleoside-triphosphate reductase activating protein